MMCMLMMTSALVYAVDKQVNVDECETLMEYADLFCVKEPARYVSTCPELTADFTCGLEKMDCQSKLLLRNLEPRTDSAPSVLPVPQSTANNADRPSVSCSVVGVSQSNDTQSASHRMAQSDLPVSQSVTDVGMSGVDLTGPQSQDGRCETSASCQPPQPPDRVTSLSCMTDASPQPLQSVASIDVIAVCTSTPEKLAAVAASSKMVDSADLPAECSSFVCHEENACDRMIGMSYVASVPREFGGDFTGSASQPSVGNSECIDRVQHTLLSNRTVTNGAEMLDNGSSRVFAALESLAAMPYVNEAVEMSSVSVSAPLCAGEEAMIVAAADDDSRVSASVSSSEVCQQSAAVDQDVADTMMSFSSAVAECDESHSTLDDSRLVSIT